MTGAVSIYAMTEMHKRVGECMLKIRSELARIGCNAEELQVLRQGSYLQLTYQRQQVVLVAPNEVLSVLHKIPRGTSEAEVWEQLANHVRQVEKTSALTKGWLLTVAGSFIAMCAFLIFLKNI